MARKLALRTELQLNLAILAAIALLLGAMTSLLIGVVAQEYIFPLVLVVVALDVAVFIAFGRVLIRRLVLVPMGRLMEAADGVARGDLGARAPDAETTDFTALARRFNEMTDHLLDAQGQLVRSEKLASVGRVAAGIAHEVGNPLGALGTYLEVLQKRGADPVIAADMRRELDRIDSIIRSLLDYAKARDDAREVLNPGAVARGAFDLLSAQGAMKPVYASVDIASDLPPIRASAHLLQQALVNLLLNAVEAAADGTVTLTALRWEYERRNPSPRRSTDAPAATYPRSDSLRPTRTEFAPGIVGLLVVVADSGPGIPAEDHDRVFEPFMTTKPAGKGTGLGLAIVARIVDQLGGVIWIDSAREGGAAFKLFFPAAGDA